MSIGRVGDSPKPVVTPPAQEPVKPQKAETVNRVKPASVPSSYERQGRGSLDQPQTDEGKEVAAAKQQLFGALGALGPGGKIDGAPVEQRAQEIQGLLQKAGVPAEKAATAGDVLRSYQQTLAAGGHDASGLETAIGRAESAGVLSATDAGTVREIAYANLPEAAAANAAKSSGGALQSAISQAEGGKLPDAAELRDLLERGGVEHKYAQAAANAVRHLERAEEASHNGDVATVKAELGFLRAERAKAVKGGALAGQPLAALNAAVERLQGDAPPEANFAAPPPAATAAAPQPAAAPETKSAGRAAPPATTSSTAAPATATTSSTAPAAQESPKPGSPTPIELSKDILSKAGAAAAPELQAAATKAASGDYAGAFAALGRAGKTAAPEVVAQVASKLADRLPENGAGGVARAVLKDPKAVTAILTDATLPAAVGKLAGGDLSALKDIATSPAGAAVTDAALNSAPLKAGLEKLGLTAADVKAAGRALPDLVHAGEALAKGDATGALRALGDAATHAGPDAVTKAITKAAAHLPETGALGVARALFSDPALVKKVLTNPETRKAFDAIASGKPDAAAAAVGTLLEDPSVRDASLGALANDKQLLSKLAPLGIKDAKDLQAVGASLGDLLGAEEAARAGHYGDALSALGKAAKDLPPELRGRIAGTLADRAHAPPWLKEALVGAAGLLDNKAVQQSLSGAFTALKNGNVGDLVTNLASAGKAIASASPEVASGFLDTLGKLPGSLGKLFQDKQFNQSLVKSGAVNELLDAASALAHGKLSDAASAVAGAGAKLLGEGEHFKVGGQELPFGRQGIENLTRAFGRFVDALPPSVKLKITEEAAKLGAKAGLKSVPLLGNLVNAGAAVGDAADLYQAIRAQPRNTLDIALAAAQVGLDVAGVVPGLNSITGPLGIVLGTAKVVVGGVNLVGDLKSFQSSLVSL